MEGNPPRDGSGTAGDRPSASPHAAGKPPRVETLGPLTVRHLVKDDGRALIVYERVDPPTEVSGDPDRGGARA